LEGTKVLGRDDNLERAEVLGRDEKATRLNAKSEERKAKSEKRKAKSEERKAKSEKRLSYQLLGNESLSSVVSAHSMALCCSRVSLIPPRVR